MLLLNKVVAVRGDVVLNGTCSFPTLVRNLIMADVLKEWMEMAVKIVGVWHG